MKILFNCLSMEKGGAERVISVLANKFIETNDVTILTMIKETPKYDLNNNIKLIHIDNKNYFKANKIKKILFKVSPRRLIYMSKKIKEEKPDIIISFLPEPSLKLMILKRISKTVKQIPTIISIRNDPKVEYSNKFIHFAMKTLYKNVDGLVLQTEEALEYFKDIVKNENRLTIIPNPINEKFIVDKGFEGQREKTIVTVGRLEKQKNHRLLIDSFKEVEKKHKDYKLLLYGKGSLREQLEEYSCSIGLKDKVVFKGQIDNIKEEIYKAGIFVLSSNYEGMPNALMEAMALGLPCLSTDCPCGGPKALIENNTNGVLVEVGNKEQIVNAINKIIEDKQFAKTIGDNANKIKDTYSVETICEKWNQKIKKTLKTRG